MNIKKILPPERKKVIKETLLLMAQNPNALALQSLISRFDCEAENLKTLEYYSSKELVEILENGKNYKPIKTKNMAQTTNNKKPAFTANKAKTAPKKETTNIYPKGIICFNPHENAPDFVVGKCIIALADLQDFIAENSNLIHNHETYGEQLKLDILRGEKGLYMKVDTFGLDK